MDRVGNAFMVGVAVPMGVLRHGPDLDFVGYEWQPGDKDMALGEPEDEWRDTWWQVDRLYKRLEIDRPPGAPRLERGGRGVYVNRRVTMFCCQYLHEVTLTAIDRPTIEDLLSSAPPGRLPTLLACDGNWTIAR